MKHLLLTTIAAVLLVGCGESAPDISIHQAAETGNIEAVKQHLAAGTDVNAKNMRKWTPLHWAAFSGHKEIAELLIAKGADVNAKTADGGKPPLYYAVWYDHTEIAKLLISKGANVNTEQSPMYNPLYSAAGGGAGKETIELLIANGADVNFIRERGGTKGNETPLDRAARKGRTETADLLRKHGGKTGEELKAAGK